MACWGSLSYTLSVHFVRNSRKAARPSGRQRLATKWAETEQALASTRPVRAANSRAEYPSHDGDGPLLRTSGPTAAPTRCQVRYSTVGPLGPAWSLSALAGRPGPTGADSRTDH